jgi:hypothetical protein
MGGVVRRGHFIGGRMSAEYAAWSGMWSRCTNPNKRDYPRYGGRGISVSEEWRDFENFYRDLGPRPSPDHSLDRENNDGNYEPGNVRWATSEVQRRNTRSNRFVEYRGTRMVLADAVRLSGVNYATARQRLVAGWSDEDALR